MALQFGVTWYEGSDRAPDVELLNSSVIFFLFDRTGNPTQSAIDARQAPFLVLRQSCCVAQG